MSRSRCSPPNSRAILRGDALQVAGTLQRLEFAGRDAGRTSHQVPSLPQDKQRPATNIASNPTKILLSILISVDIYGLLAVFLLVKGL